MAMRVLVVDDEADARALLVGFLSKRGYGAVGAADASAASRELSSQGFDAILLDVRMPGLDGLALLEQIRAQPRPPSVVMMTAYASPEDAVRAMKAGAFDYLSKPLNVDALLLLLERIAQSRSGRRDRSLLARQQADASAARPLLGEASAFTDVLARAEQVAPTDATVLLRGESGTGKEGLARALHTHSHRADGPFVALHCAALPDSLLEAELFGYEKGAFTGATSAHEGRIELSDGGTLFLDEIGEVPLATQVKLLRVLQERQVEHLGGRFPIAVDCRLIAATNRNLEEAVAKGTFREDLYYRLKVVELRLPPLRERPSDVPLLAEHFLAQFARRHGKSVKGFSAAAMALLKAHRWPGNVRELENVVESAVVFARGGTVEPGDLPALTALVGPGGHSADAAHAYTWERPLVDVEREHIAEVLRHTSGNLSRAAEVLGIHRNTLRQKVREFGLNARE